MGMFSGRGGPLSGRPGGAGSGGTVVTSPAITSYTSGTKTVAGTAEAGATVHVFKDQVEVGTATADGSGNWSYVFSVAPITGSVLGATQTVGVTSGFSNLVPVAPPETSLGPLSLSSASFIEGTASGTVIGAIQGRTPGSTVTIAPADGRAAIDGSGNLIVGLTPAAAGSFNITLRETLAGATNSPRDTDLALTVIPAAVSPGTIDLPAGTFSFWSLMRSTGWAGDALRVKRSSDGAEQDFGFDGNQVLNEAAVLAFVGAGNGLVSRVFDQVGGTDAVMATDATMPILVEAGVMVRNASGIPAMKICVDGRYLLAAGAFTPVAGQDFSLSALAQNNVDQQVPTNNLFSPIIGISTAAGANLQRAHLLFGARSASTGRNAVLELATATAGTNEIGGYNDPIAQFTTCLLTSTCLASALSGGPGAGTTLYLNRSAATTVENASHSPAALLSATDVRLGALANASWTTNSANGAAAQLTSAGLFPAMTDAVRQDLEGAIWAKWAAILSQSLTLPTLDANSEAWDFSTYASDQVAGLKGNTNLQFETAANGSAFSLTKAPSGVMGLYEGVTNNFKNDFQSSNGWGQTETTFTHWCLVTVDDPPSSRIFDFIMRGVGTLGSTSSRYVSDGLSKDHSPFCGYSLDVSNPGGGSDYTNMMLGSGDPYTGGVPLLPFSPLAGGGLLTHDVPAHDNNSNHPYAYTKKKFLGNRQTTDKGQFHNRQGMTVLLLMKHKPHPNYNLAEPWNSANNVLWRNKATVIVKAADLGCLDGFGKIPGGRSDYLGAASTAIPNASSRFRHYGGENINTMKGWMHAAGFYAGKFTTDAEDQALFYSILNLSKLL